MQTQREKLKIIVRDFNTLLTSMNRSSRPDRRLIKKGLALKDTTVLMDLGVFIEHSIQKQQNTHSFQVHMEHFSGYLTCVTQKKPW